ncbi:hypothetical protein N7486_005240 [Penicillium sp. IBT 16267x]|nr:hypothetical protein N7486_005240 [Penicillium sp. IBT 16267x]
MSLRSHDWVPQPSQSPATPGTSIFERAMHRSNNARDQTPTLDNIEDVDYESSTDSFQTSPCARLSDSSLLWSGDNTPTLGSVWENDTNPNSGWYFDIREDSPDKESPSHSTPRSYGGMEEEKENILPSSSDYESPIQTQPQTYNAGFNGLNNLQQDAFGFASVPYADALADLSVNRYGYAAPPASIFAYEPVPARSPMEMELDEEDEARGEHRGDWRRVLNDDHIRELQRLTDAFSRGLEQRGLHGVHYTMPDERFQGFSNTFMEDQRVTEHQGRRTRGPNSEGEEN